MFATRDVVVHALRRSFLRITLERGAGQRSNAICPTTVPSLIHYQPLTSRAHEASDRRAGADLTPFGRVSSAYLCFHRSFAHVCALKHWRKIICVKCVRFLGYLIFLLKNIFEKCRIIFLYFNLFNLQKRKRITMVIFLYCDCIVLCYIFKYTSLNCTVQIHVRISTFWKNYLCGRYMY